MRKIYNKLVRDRIPAIIQSECRDCQTRRLTSAEYQTELKAGKFRKPPIGKRSSKNWPT